MAVTVVATTSFAFLLLLLFVLVVVGFVLWMRKRGGKPEYTCAPPP